MTNEEKYRTIEERIRAFHEFCDNNECEFCELKSIFEKEGSYACIMHWLALEAEEEKPEPCPFCGGEPRPSHLVGGFSVCCGCGYTSQFAETEEDAIAAHNRVARAVRAAEKGEAK